MPPVSHLIAYSLSLFAAGAIICQIFAGQGETNLRYYELMMVVPQMDEEGLSATLDRVNNDIGERGGTVVRQQRWGGLRRLAYPINDHNEGNYVLTYLELEPERASDLEANLRVSENVLRHLLLRIDAIPEVKEAPPQPAPAAAPVDTAAEAPAATEEAPATEATEATSTETQAEAEVVEAAEAVTPAEEPVAEAQAEAVAETEEESAPEVEAEPVASEEAPEAQAEEEGEENKEQEA